MGRSDVERLTHIARKLETYFAIYKGDKEALQMARWCKLRAGELLRGADNPLTAQVWNPAELPHLADALSDTKSF